MGSTTIRVPPPPSIGPKEMALLDAQTSSLKSMQALLEEQQGQNREQQSIYKSLSGLYDANGNLDMAKLSDLQAKTAKYQGQADEISGLQSERYLKALKGELPVSEGTLQRKEKDFQLLQESAARKGNMISGATPEGAYGNSSAAAANLGEFNRTYGLIQDAERRGELASGGMGMAPASMSLGYSGGANAFSPQSLAPGYASLAGGYGQATQPFAEWRGQLNNRNQMNAGLLAQDRSDRYQLAGTVVGMGMRSMAGA